jgi:nucleoside-diphosphate-sugar epimerase
MRVVVVGATGNVGMSVIDALIPEPAITSIVGVCRRPPSVELPKVRWQAADIAVDALDDVVAGADAIVDLAWKIQPQRDEAAMLRTNVVGTMRLFHAAARAGVPAFIYASSVGTYAPGPKSPHVDESWDHSGVPTSVYSRHKAAVEALLDDAETDTTMRVVRMRTSLVFKAQASSEIGRLFFGPLIPRRLMRPGRVPFVPRTPNLTFQATHASDIADAYKAAVLRDVRGAFNIAAEPVIDPFLLARVLNARSVRVPGPVLRAVVAAAWHARAVPIEPGWIDLGLRTPLMRTDRARAELEWRPRHSSTDALRELFEGLAVKSGGPTPPLEPSLGGAEILPANAFGADSGHAFR